MAKAIFLKCLIVVMPMKGFIPNSFQLEMNLEQSKACKSETSMNLSWYKKIFFLLSIFSLISMLIISCSDAPMGVLNSDKMQAVYWDIIVADMKTQDFIRKDSTKKDSFENAQLQQKIFAMHQTNRDQFYKSLEYYKSNPEKMNLLLDSMVSKANRERYSPSNFIKPIINADSNTQSRIRPQIDSIKKDE